MGREDVDEDEELLSSCGGSGGMGMGEIVVVVVDDGFFLSSIKARSSENSAVDGVAESPRSPRSGTGTFAASFDLKLPFGRPLLRTGTTTTGGVSGGDDEEMIPLLLLSLLVFPEGLVVAVDEGVVVVVVVVVVTVAPLELETGEFVPELSRPKDEARN